MKRQLAIADQRPGHPFRDQVLGSKRPKLKRGRSEDDSDLKLFVLSYTAFFVCFYSFLM